MALSTEDLEQIATIIKNTLHGGCVCGLSESTQTEVGHFFGRLKDLGEGNLNRGIERFSDVVEMVTAWRSFGAKVGGTVAVALCVAVAGGFGTLLFIGIKSWAKKVMGE